MKSVIGAMLSVACLVLVPLEADTVGPGESDSVGVVVSITPSAEPTPSPEPSPTPPEDPTPTPTPTDQPSPAPSPDGTTPAPDRLATTGSPPVAGLLICSAALITLGWFFIATRRRHHTEQ